MSDNTTRPRDDGEQDVDDAVQGVDDEERWAADEAAHPAQLREPLPDHECEEDHDRCDDSGTCGACGGVVGYLGSIGNYHWYTCRHCGMEHGEPISMEEKQ